MVTKHRTPGWPALLVGAGGVVVVVGAALLGLLLFGRPKVSLTSGKALVQVKVSGLGTKLASVTATADGRRLALTHGDGGLVPSVALPEDQQVHLTATAQARPWLHWLLGGVVTRTMTVRTPAALPSGHVAVTSSAGQVPVSFDTAVSVVDYRAGGTSKTFRLARPSRIAELSVPAGVRAGSLQVAAAPLPWEEAPAPSHTVTWFVAQPGSTVALVDPSPGSTGASSDGPITITFDKPVAQVLGSTRPTLAPPVPGTWSEPGRDTLVFTPSGFGFGPGTSVGVTVSRPVSFIGSQPIAPATSTAAHTTAAQTASTYHFTVGPGSILRLEEILAQLHYLPLNFTPATGVRPPATFAAEVATMSDPLPGSFSWRWASTPASLRAQWAQGAPNLLLKGALMAFVADHESSYDGYQVDNESVQQLAGATTWKELLAAAAANQLDPNPYSYVFVTQTLPETLTLWENGAVVLTSPANTGIPAAPTADGTFPIYVRYTFNYMSGFNPNGSYYHDPVYWINYFNGGDAVHGFPRASYGFPQSLGCVELPISTAHVAFSHLAIGDLVTVAN